MAALSEAVLRYAKQAWQKQSPQTQSLDSYLQHLADPKTSASLPVTLDTSHPISHYFISSSHNTYLSGNQLWGRSSADAYKDVLKRSCRCIEIDIWDGDSASSSDADNHGRGRDKDLDVNRLSGMIRRGIGRLRSRSNADRIAAEQVAPDSPAETTLMPTPWRTNSDRDEPIVYHGYTATAEMPFRDVCEAVRKYAFRSSDLPVIVSLEIHCSHPQQQVVVEYMQSYWKEFLVSLPEDFGDTTPLPTLESLKKKILVKVKYVAPEKAKAIDDGSKDSDQDSVEDDPPTAVKKGRILDKLSNMGIFTRAFHFSNFDQAEATIPTHVFSLSETKLLAACEEQADKLFHHNLHHLMRAYPKGTRLRSSNLDPAPLWRFGLQMVALNFQTMNAAMMLQHAQFEDTGGWVLKPRCLLPNNQPPSVVPDRHTVNVSIKVLAGHDLGPKSDVPNAYVKCELHVESRTEAEDGRIPNGAKAKGGEFKRRSAVRHSRDPDFGAEELAFAGVRHVVPELSFVRIKVMDDALAKKDRLLGWACYRLDRMPQGLLLVHLRSEDSKPCDGRLLVNTRVVLGSVAA